MSNYLAVATVTAILQRILQAEVQLDVGGARVTTLQPSNLGMGPPETGVNLFLYLVNRNLALNNADATPFRSKGTPVKRQAALDLYYMLSFYGNETELEPQRLLGSVVRTLNDRPVLLPEMIQAAISGSAFTFLADSDLDEQIQQLLIVPIDLNLDELSKIWSIFFQTPYALSLTYKVTVVMIEGETPAKRALPVRDRRLGGAFPYPARPVVERVIAQEGPFELIGADSTLLILGRQLQGSRTQIRIGEVEATPIEVTDTKIIIPLASLLPGSLRAGVQSLQVIHRPIIPDGETRNPKGLESNVVPFVLRPTIQRASLTGLVGGETGRSADVLIETDVTVGKRQRVVLALNEFSIQDPAVYLFEAAVRDQDSTQVRVPIQAVKPGEYLLRLMVDGAESQLQVDNNPASPTFSWFCGPKLAIL